MQGRGQDEWGGSREKRCRMRGKFSSGGGGGEDIGVLVLQGVAAKRKKIGKPTRKFSLAEGSRKMVFPPETAILRHLATVRSVKRDRIDLVFWKSSLGQLSLMGLLASNLVVVDRIVGYLPFTVGGLNLRTAQFPFEQGMQLPQGAPKSRLIEQVDLSQT